MRRQAKASSAGSVLGIDEGLARQAALLLAFALALVAAAVLPSGAGAAGQAKLALITDAGSPMLAPTGIATNRTGAGGVGAGDFYVADRGNHRIARFNADGEFVSVFGLGVNQDTGGDVCTAASGNVCQGGGEGAAAGAVWFPVGVAVDQSTGTVFVYTDAGHRVNVFSAQGLFQGAFGWEVDATKPEAKLQFCTVATGCLNGGSSSEAGGFGGEAIPTRSMDVDSSGNLYVPDLSNRRIDQFSFTFNGSDEVTGVSFVQAIGWKVNAATPEERLQICTTASGCLQGAAGSGDGQFGTQLTSVAVDSAGSIYALTAGGQDCTAADPCRVQKFNADGTFKEIFGPSAGVCRLVVDDSSPAPASQGMAVAVDPSTQNVLVLKKVSPLEMQVCEFDSEGNELASFPSPPLSVDFVGLSAGLAVGLGGHVYAANAFPGLYLLGPAPAPNAEILPVTDVGQTSAKLSGVVTVPVYKSGGFPTTYQFELSSNQGFTWTKVPVPAASAGEIAGPVTVQQTATGLQPSKNYLVRLVATTGPAAFSATAQFTTDGAAPSVAYANGASPLTDVVNPYQPTTAKLAGFVNPNNQLTTYRFEYGPTTAYGMQSPAEFEPSAGEGGTPLLVKANLSGLQPATVYHYRIVAGNPSGPTFGPDRQFETAEQRQAPNSCGLPDNRCLELVSPAEKGPITSVGGNPAGGADLQIQPSTGGGGIAYQLINGLPGSTAPNEVLYRSIRSSTGWTASQLSPPLTEQNQTKQPSAIAGYTRALSPDLSCGVVLSPFRLTPDTPTRVLEAGGTNIYRRDNQTGDYQIITNLPPTNLPLPPGQAIQNPLSLDEYEVIGISADCRRVVFAARYLYSGVSGVTTSQPGQEQAVYEWHDGVLRGVGHVPGPSGEVEVPVSPGAPSCGPCSATSSNVISAVSEGGERTVFTATSQLGSDQGTTAVFSRVDATSTVDVSQSQTATPTAGARFQAASADGTKVFFTANYGIADESSSGPTGANCAGTSFTDNDCDLYEYDFSAPPGQRLTDLSAHTAEPDGASVAGVVATSQSGEYVYFAARAQLVAGAGPTFAENREAGTYSVFLAHAGTTEFVGVVQDADLIGGPGLLMSAGRGSDKGQGWATHVTPDGKSLLFGSRANVTGFDPAGTVQAYLFSADTGATVCVSCRRDGGVPVFPGPAGDFVMPVVRLSASNGLRHLLTLTPDGHRVFFLSRDALAPGALEGERNLYEWQRGQVYLLGTADDLMYYGSSNDGSEVYFATAERLNWEDEDSRADLYVARSGGGFTQPPPPPPACNPLLEGSCAGAPASAPPAALQPPSALLSGPGNPPAQKPSKKGKKGKKKGKKQRGKQKGGSGSKNRSAHGNRGTSK